MPTEYDSLLSGDKNDSSTSTPAAATPPQPQSNSTLRQALIAEFIGTCVLVQVGTGGNCTALYEGATSGMWQIAVLWILAGTLGVMASGSISGGHLNPAVTLAFALVRPGDFDRSKVLPYWGAQLAGAASGALINFAIFFHAIAEFEDIQGLARGEEESILSASALSDYYSLSPYVGGWAHALVLEAFGTAFLVFVIFMATHPNNNVPSSAISIIVGTAIGCMVTILGPLTNAGINPARDLGPRIVLTLTGWGMSSWTGWLLYTLGPLAGAPIGAVVADMLLMK